MKAKNKRTKLLAFTLVETLLVLFCCSIFLLLPVLSIQSWQKRIEIQQFLASFEKKVLFTQQMAIVSGMDTHLYLDEENQELFFYATKKINDPERLIIPENLKVSGPKKISFKRITGNNGNLSKFVFYWEAEKKTVEYQFQMGSGRFVKKVIEF